mmetsp:Transcript_25546/g.40989  ORF Transcript_25546/g.40989 Transcript_25546/m.40989 type:complete len:196 (-) Transcript_25546:913-1500(-)
MTKPTNAMLAFSMMVLAASASNTHSRSSSVRRTSRIPRRVQHRRQQPPRINDNNAQSPHEPAGPAVRRGGGGGAVVSSVGTSYSTSPSSYSSSSSSSWKGSQVAKATADSTLTPAVSADKGRTPAVSLAALPGAIFERDYPEIIDEEAMLARRSKWGWIPVVLTNVIIMMMLFTESCGDGVWYGFGADGENNANR